MKSAFFFVLTAFAGLVASDYAATSRVHHAGLLVSDDASIDSLVLVDYAGDDGPAPEILGERNVPEGQGTILKIPASVAGTDFEWSVEPKTTKTIWGENRNETFLVMQDLPAGRYFVSFVSWDRRKHVTEIVIAGDGVPEPVNPDQPVDPVKPKPPAPKPNDEFGIAAPLASWVASLPASARSQASARAKVYRECVAEIRKGGNGRYGFDVDKPLNAFGIDRIGQDLIAKLDSIGGGWEPVAEQANAKLSKLYSDKKLPTFAKYADFLDVIAGVLEAMR